MLIGSSDFPPSIRQRTTTELPSFRDSWCAPLWHQIPNAAAIREDSWRALLLEMTGRFIETVSARTISGYAAFLIELFLIVALARA